MIKEITFFENPYANKKAQTIEFYFSKLEIRFKKNSNRLVEILNG